MPALEDTTQEQIIQKIKYDSRGAWNRQIAKNILEQWRDSKAIQDMITAQAYYKVENEGSGEKTRSYRDYDGRVVENQTASNVKLKSGYMRLSVEQKLNYAFAKPFVLEITHKENPEVMPELELYRKEWDNFLDDDNRDILTGIALDAINRGIGWAYVSIDRDGELADRGG